MKRFFVCFLLAASFSEASAQFSLGLKAGLNFANLAVSNTTEYSDGTTTQFYGGIFANYKMKQPFRVQIEINYSAEGENGSIKQYNEKDNIRSAFINIPVQFQYVTKFGLYAETGPQIGFLLSIKEAVDKDPYHSIKEYYKSTDFSWDFGLGYILPKYVPGLGINVRYALGLGAINNESIAGNSLKSRVFSIGLLYAFKINTKTH